MGRIDGKVAIITGGSRGIGKAVCLLLAKEGAKVAVVARTDIEGNAVVSEIKNKGGVAQFWHVDVTKDLEIKDAWADIAKTFGQIDVLVNNAGISGHRVAAHEQDEEEWDQIMNANAKGTFLCTKHVIPYMRKAGKGSIINMSSITGLVGHDHDPAYHASKGAIRLETKVDAISYGKDKIRVNSIHPGYTVTPAFESFANSFPEGSEAFKKKILSTIPLDCLEEPEDIAYGVLYLASDESKYVTGSELVIDGGYTCQ